MHTRRTFSDRAVRLPVRDDPVRAAGPGGVVSGGGAGRACHAVVLQLQRAAGNRAVVQMLRATPPGNAMPPKRPKIRSGSGSSAVHRPPDRPMTMGEIYLAIQKLELKAIRPEDLALLDNSELRTLDSVLEQTISRCRGFAEEQAVNPGFIPPDGFPDFIYKNVVQELEQFRDDQITSRHPHHVIRAIVAYYNLAGLDVGTSAEAKALWKICYDRVKEMLWRLELGSAGVLSGKSLESFLTADEVLQFGYVDRMVWDTISRNPLFNGKIIPDEAIVAAIRSQNTLLPVVLANFLVGNASRYNAAELLEALGAQLDDVDKAIAKTLTSINSDRVTGGLSETYTHENVFWEWLWRKNAMVGTVYGCYRSWAGE